jgi:hypothetical protein
MYDNWNYGLKMDVLLVIMFMCLMFVSAEDVAKEPQISPVAGEHTIAKRAWQQLQGSWGKRNIDDEPKQDSLEDLQRRVMLLLANRVDEGEYVPDYDETPEKRAWQSMGNGEREKPLKKCFSSLIFFKAWGKRNWSQMRGAGWGKREAGNWNNMRGLWGKRTPG